jgi:hypothetical protein
VQKKLLLILILVVAAVIPPIVIGLNRPNSANGDPCDSYGNCIFSSVSYVRSNPDQSLYLGDEFSVIPSTSTGPNTTSISIGWSYDSGVLSALGGELFQVVGNVTGTYFVTVTETFTVVEIVGNSTVTIQSPLSTSVSVETRTFELAFQTQMSNVTNSAHQVLRNPDGSFYHDDEFVINYTYSFLFMQQRPDIKVIVEPHFNPTFVKLTSFSNSSSTGYFLFTVANQTGTSAITITAKAFNYQDALLASKTQKQLFAVVNYAPYFKFFTYMEYNSANSSSYQRPFVTLIRYDGNNPGYSYGGDVNTAPITAVNDTRERALINSFNFAVTGWGVNANLTTGDISHDISFWNETALNLATKTTNTTYPVLTFSQRIEKFYFTSSVPEIQSYASDGLEYFNVTELALSKGFAGGIYGLFNTSYLYQPFYYNGYITVFTYGPSGLDPSDSVSISLVTPDPLDPHLLASLNQTFGSSQEIAKDFEEDLFPAYSNVMSLEPVSSSGGRWVFLLNDTNVAMMNDTTMPYLFITVTGASGSYSYTVPDAFSSFLVNRTLIPSLPFSSVDGYYLDQQRQLVALPLNFSLIVPSNPYLAWDYNGSSPSFISPVTYEPGNLSSAYGFLYGGNSTIYANLDGGGGSLVNIQRQQTNFEAFEMIGPQTGGVTSLWVKDPTGNLIVNESLTPNTEPPSPSGYYGFYDLSFPMSVNGTYQFGTTNSWGVSSVFQTYDNVAHIPPPPDEEYFLMTFFGFLIVGLYFLGRISTKFKSAFRRANTVIY